MVDFPAIFGHEGAGHIKAIGSGVKDKSLKVGDAVLLSYNVCGKCNQCQAGHPAYCHIHPQVNHNAVRLEDRSTPARLQDGTPVRSQYFGHSSFARQSVVKERCVVKCEYPEQMHWYAAMGCGFQTGAGTVLNVLKPKKSDSVVIFGLGGVGLTALMAARVLGVEQLVAIDLIKEKLDLAKQLGATDVVSGKESDVVARVKEICSKNGGATFAIDCTGVLKVIEQCIESLAPCGTAVTVGVPPPDSKISIDPLMFLLGNKRYIGVIEGDSVPKEVCHHHRIISACYSRSIVHSETCRASSERPIPRRAFVQGLSSL
jgi:Zn-dependent alcohol dehydrogenase